jgi:glycine cleavage system transcriptional repressor
VWHIKDSGRFKLEGADNPGIVHKVTSILSRNGLSIDKMETSDELAPQGSAVLFKMVGVVNAYQPLMAGIDIEKVKSELSDLGDDLNCDISMEDLAKH